MPNMEWSCVQDVIWRASAGGCTVGHCGVVGMPAFVFFHHVNKGPEQGERFVEIGKERIHHPLVRTLDYRLPAAPQQPSRGGMPHRAWYEMQMTHEDDEVFVFGKPQLVIEAVARLKKYIYAIVDKGTPSREIVLCGFRQGAAMLAAAIPLLEDMELGGVVLISGYLPAHDTVREWIMARGGSETLGNLDMPILAVHGSNDTHIETALRQKTDTFFKESGYRNHKTVEAMFLDSHHMHITDGMWMFVWQFVIQVLG